MHPSTQPDVVAAGLAFSILGPIEVARDGRPLPVHSLKTRALLALLLLHRGRPVGLALLIERIWDHPPPPTAQASARNVVSALRRLLGGDDRVSITTGAAGYVLDAPAESLDLTTFDTLRARGRALLAAGDPDAAAECLVRALALWRGSALMDLSLAGFDWPETGELTESRLAGVEDLLQADLDRHRYRDVLIRLAPVLAEQPGRETLHRARIIALHRCGRRAEAAGAYLEARRLIVDVTGHEPSAEFRDVHRRILAEEQSTVDSQAPPQVARFRARAPRWSARRSDGGSRTLIPRIGPAERSAELAHEVRAVAVLCVRVCAPTAPKPVIDQIGDIVREHGGVVGDIRGTTVVTYFGLGVHHLAGDEVEAGRGATGQAAACAIALHRSGSIDRVRAGDLNGDALAAQDGPTAFACVVSSGPVMHVVRENGPGEATSWVASEIIGLCEKRAEQVRPGETAIF